MSVLRRLIALLLVLTLAPIAAASVHAAATRDQVPPILLNGENGTLGINIYLGTTTDTMSIPQMGTVPIKVCDGADCETYTANYLSNAEGYSMHRWITIQQSIGTRFSKKPVTVQVANDFSDVSKGWSAASNATTGWSDSAAWYRAQEKRPIIEILFEKIESTSISKIDICSNYKADLSFTSGMSSSFNLSLTGYTTAKFELLDSGVVSQTKDATSSLTGSPSIPTCGANAFSPFSTTQFTGLNAGKSYSLKFTLTGAGKPDLVATLDFVTPGACPTGAITFPPSPRPFYYGAMDTNGVLQSYLMSGVAQWRIQDVLPKRIAPIYFSPNKVGPFNGQLLKIRDSAQKWKYLADRDDWALVVDNATSTSAANVLANTVFADCTSTQVKATLSIDESTTKAADQGCTIANNAVVPTKVGICSVKAQVESGGVSSAQIRSQAASSTVTMNYEFTSVSPTTTTTMAPTTTIAASTTKKCSFAMSKAKPNATFTNLLKCAGLKKTSKQKVSVVIATSSKSVCRSTSSALVRKKKGTCTVTVRVMTGSKVASSKKVQVSAT